jgi:hypothetical protein
MTNSPSLGHFIADALGAYADAPSLEQFLDEQLGAEGAEVLRFLERIDSCEDEVRAAREGGITTARWLGNQLANAEIGALPPSTIERLASLAPGVKGHSVEAAGQRILVAAQVAMGMGAEALGASEQGGVGLLDEISAPQATALVDQFLQSPFGDGGDRSIVAAAAVGLIKGADKLGLKADPVQLTSLADLGFRAAKVAHKVGTGELSGTGAALDLITDRFAAQVGAYAGKALEQGITTLGAVVGTFIETQIPMGGKAIQVGQEVGRIAGKVARPFVEQGVRQLSRRLFNEGRRLVEAVVQKAPVVLGALKEAVLSWF